MVVESATLQEGDVRIWTFSYNESFATAFIRKKETYTSILDACCPKKAEQGLAERIAALA